MTATRVFIKQMALTALPFAKCFDFTIWRDNHRCLKKGCFTMDSQVLFYCNKVNLKVVNNLTSGYEGFCCNEQSFCNRSPVSPDPVNLVTVVAISASIILFCLLIPLILYIVLKRKRAVNDRKRRRRNVQKDKRNEENSTLDSAALKYITSGSGAGFPLLIERTLTKEIQLETQISKGKFGEVWKANYQNRKVAVKKVKKIHVKITNDLTLSRPSASEKRTSFLSKVSYDRLRQLEEGERNLRPLLAGERIHFEVPRIGHNLERVVHHRVLDR